MPGGRQLYREKLGTAHANATLEVSRSVLVPGQKVAAPGNTPGDLANSVYICGTSNSAALGSRLAAQIHDLLVALRQEPGGEVLLDQYLAVVVKTLMVHGASWGDAYEFLEQTLKRPSNSRRFKEYAARFLGYGVIDPSRVLHCTDQRVTLLGCGILKDGGAHIYTVPLPPSLSGKKVHRRLVRTLAWITPVDPLNPAYLGAQLWATPTDNPLQAVRVGADFQAVQRGTVQHEIFEGEKAAAFTEEDAMQIIVNCRKLTDELEEGVPYCLAVTLEVAPSLNLQIYDEIRLRIRPEIRIVPPIE